jgi:hypothetical protein
MVNRVGSYTGVVLLIAIGLPFILTWYEDFNAWLASWPNSLLEQIGYLGLLFGGFVIGIGLHELIHGLTWSILVEKGWKHVRFGIFRPSGTPYCHLSKPVELRCYLIGLLMPGILTGLGPLLIGFWQGSGLLLLWGVFLTQSATGDVMMAYHLWGEPKGTLIQDHSEQLGYWAYPPDQGSA